MENIIKVLSAVGGAAVTFLFGGWSYLLTVLIVFVCIDYGSGVAAGAAEGKLKSKIGLIGIARKLFIFGIIAIAHMLDTALGDQHVIRSATIFFYMANELLSILENAGRIGLPVPDVVKRAVEVLKDKGGANN
ncbi:holin family protein [Brevibacillus laterosporus]|uniref:phage holin family protein n=1 Tax=Brevibacillus laterosporus TaxID=1465 RepID=UPI0014441875|nr:holin family protein [Brevibacillus laterosporus]NKQ20485.1 phage holin family protein [Brevibacillus laterosporus]WNX32616.1 holin family protein [Brevibacillus laterosporus]